MRYMVAVAAFFFTACSSESPSLEYTDSIADKKLAAEFSQYPFLRHTAESKKRTSIKEVDGNIYDVKYEYTLTLHYDFKSHLEHNLNGYYKTINAGGIASGFEALFDKKTTLVDAASIFFRDYRGDISQNDLKEASDSIYNAEKLVNKLNSDDAYKAKIFEVIERCGGKCAELLTSNISDPSHITDTKFYAFLLAASDMLDDGMDMPDKKQGIKTIEFQVQNQK